MPNWCWNVLTVSGDDERLAAFDAAFIGFPARWPDAEPAAEPSYSFNALYPVPAEVIERGYAPALGRRSFAALVDPDAWVDGYSWCVSHWGTNWDIHGCDVDVDVLPGKRVYAFSTAWSPPLPWVQKVAADWPDLEFLIVYEEGGMAIAGKELYAGGMLVWFWHADSIEEYRRFVAEEFGYVDDEDDGEDAGDS